MTSMPGTSSSFEPRKLWKSAITQVRTLNRTAALMHPSHKYIQVLRKPQNERSQEELTTFAHILTGTKAFELLPLWQVCEYAKDFTLVQVPEGEVLTSPDESARSYCIILKGSCEEHKAVKSLARFSSFHASDEHGQAHVEGEAVDNHDVAPTTSQPTPVLRRSDIFANSVASGHVQHHGSLSSGDDFGHRALRKQGGEFGSFVTVSSPLGCVLAQVSREAFLSRKQLVLAEESKRNIAFLGQLPLFSYLASSVLAKMAAGFETRLYSRGAAILRQGTRLTNDQREMYFIVSGDCRVLIEEDITSSSNAKAGSDAMSSSQDPSPMSPVRSMSSQKQFVGGYTLKNSPFGSRVKIRHSVNIAHLGPGGIFGYFDVSHHGKLDYQEPFTVLADTGVHFIVISYSSFLQSFPQAEQITLSSFARKQQRAWLKKGQRLVDSLCLFTPNTAPDAHPSLSPVAKLTSWQTLPQSLIEDDSDTEPSELQVAHRKAKSRGRLRKLKTEELLSRLRTVVGDDTFVDPDKKGGSIDSEEGKSLRDYLSELDDDDTVPELKGSLAQRAMKLQASENRGSKKSRRVRLKHLHSTPTLPSTSDNRIDSNAMSSSHTASHGSSDAAQGGHEASSDGTDAHLLGITAPKHTPSHSPVSAPSGTRKSVTRSAKHRTSVDTRGASNPRRGQMKSSAVPSPSRPPPPAPPRTPVPGDQDYQALSHLDTRIARVRERLRARRGSKP